MSQRYFQGVESATIPASIEGGSNYSGVYTLDQLNRLNAVYPAHIGNSLRFRSSASAYLSRTPGSAGNQQKFSLNLGVKRGALGSTQAVFYAGGNSTYWFVLRFNTSDQLEIIATTAAGATAIQLNTNAVYRDPSAFYLITLAVDTTNATAANRILIYVNSVSQALTISASPSQNQALSVNGTVIHTFGVLNYASTSYFDGYMADINFIDGQALSPTAFGQFYYETGVWCPMPYTGTYGTNGFHLNFSNGTSTTTLGYDSSGNGNNWTTNNISLTAGATYDWMIDSPTSFAGSSYGVGNYAVLNPLVTLNNNTASTVSEANLHLVGNSAWSPKLGTIFYPPTGKWYYEAIFSGTAFSPAGATTAYTYVGVSNTTNTANYGLDTSSTLALGDSGYGNNFAASNSLQYGSAIQSGAVVGLAIDRDANAFTFYVNGASAWSGTLNYAPSAALAPFVANYSSGFVTPYLNFGQRPFQYSPPSGYKSLCTYNLPTPSILAGNKYMDATTYAGTSSAQSIVNSGGFQPDFIWVKNRTLANNHNVYDSVRGISSGYYNQLITNDTAAENVYGAGGYGGLTAINSNGVSFNSSNANFNLTNASGSNYVAWQWKAGGTAVTNTAGSITSQVSANTTAGFSVVTYTAQSSGTGTIGHGLGIAPSMFITKQRAQTGSWAVYHASLGNTQRLLLDTTDAAATTSSYWNNTSPTSSVFTVGTGFATAGTMVAYCFAAIAGYSAFGSYTGNGSADGPFVFLGFRPRFVMIKRTDAADNWWLEDTSRNTYNVTGLDLSPNTSSAELNNTPVMDIVSNGFKLRNSYTGYNTNGGTYIYAAFCEVPFNFALAR